MKFRLGTSIPSLSHWLTKTIATAEDAAACRKRSMDGGEECPLAMKDHTLHFDLPEDQGRMVDQTYYIAMALAMRSRASSVAMV